MPSARSSARQNLSSTAADNDRVTSTLLSLNVLYQTHIHPLLPEPLQPISSSISSMFLSSAPYLSQLIGIFSTVVSSASSLASDSQDGSALVSLGVLLITMYIGLRILNYIRRTIMGWVWLGIKLFLLLVLVQFGLYVHSYGWERAIRQAGWFGGIAWGILEDMLDEHQDGQQRQPRGMRRRGEKNYDYNQYAYGQGGARGRYG